MTRLLVSLFACGLFCFVISAEEKPAARDAKVPKEVCVKPCHDCAAECAAAVKHGREKKMDENMIHHMEACHHMCLACGIAVASKEPNAWQICETCEKVCLSCAAMCEKSPDDQMKKCAKVCRDCANACATARK
jgi:hypothetical protein